MTLDERFFFDKAEKKQNLYAALVTKLTARCPDFDVRVSKTQISFCSRHIFAMVSLPRRKVNGRSDYLLVSFGLAYQKDSPRIWQSVEAYPNRWTHHVPVFSEAELDEELLDWLHEAYVFARTK